jgi:hypothetical protein
MRYALDSCYAARMSEKKQVMSLRIPPAKRQRLEDWIAAQTVPPKVTDVMLIALDRFLDENGAPPERKTKARKK